MRKNDARQLDHATLEAMRKRAVQSVQQGESPEDVARVLGINRSTMYNWLAQYRALCHRIVNPLQLFPSSFGGRLRGCDRAGAFREGASGPARVVSHLVSAPSGPGSTIFMKGCGVVKA